MKDYDKTEVFSPCSVILNHFSQMMKYFIESPTPKLVKEKIVFN